MKTWVLILILGMAPSGFGEVVADSGFRAWEKRILRAFGPEWIDGRQEKQTPVASTPTAVMTPHYLPMCFFYDPAVSVEKTNAKLQALAIAYASCGIALEVHSFVLDPGYPDDPKLLRAALTQACPVPMGRGVRAAIQVETASPVAAQRMCGDKGGTCTSLCEERPLSILPADADAKLVVQASMQTNCCGPLCLHEGEGAGIAAGSGMELSSIPPSGDFGTSNVPELGFTAPGCEALRAGANENHNQHWFNPARIEYYTRTKNPNLDFAAVQAMLKLENAVPVEYPESVKKLISNTANPQPVERVVVTPSPLPRVSLPLLETVAAPTLMLASEPVVDDAGGDATDNSKRKRGGGLRKRGSDFETLSPYDGEGGGD